MTYTLETLTDAEVELARLVRLLHIQNAEVEALGQEAKALWLKLSSRETTLNHVATFSEATWMTRHLLKRNRRSLRLAEDDAQYPSTLYEICVSTGEYAQIDQKHLVWKDLDLVDADDYVTMHEILALAAECKAAVNLLTNSRTEYREIGNWAEQQSVPTQQLHGWYVSAGNNRRSATGWVVKGRGQTIYVETDPVGFREPGVSPPRGADRTDDVLSAVWARGRAARKIEKFNRKHANVRLLLPPAEAAYRAERIADVSAKMNTVRDEGAEAYNAWQSWKEKAGSAVSRAKRIAEIRDRIQTRDPFPKSGLDSAVSLTHEQQWLVGLKSVLAPSQIEVARDKILTAAISKAGGPLTDEEKALLDAEPSGGRRSLEETTVEIFKRRFPDVALPE